jgi:hypothetical protein
MFDPKQAQQEDYDSSTDPNNPDNHSVHQFCTDPNCPDKADDSPQVQELNQFYTDGLVSADDAYRIFHGKTV